MLLLKLVPICPAVSEKTICKMVTGYEYEVMRLHYLALWSMLGKRSTIYSTTTI